MSKLLLDSFINFLSSKKALDRAYVVGGAVRDIISKKPVKDIDLAIQGDVISLGREFAQLTACTAVPFEKKSNTVRIARANIYMDISELKGNSIEDDLAERDITINAMALPLSQGSSVFEQYESHIIDPLNGRRDLEAGIIRMVSEENLKRDPVRLVRVYRFGSAPGFDIDAATKEAVKKLAPLVRSASAERIAEELRQIFSLDESEGAVKAMHESGLLAQIFPHEALEQDSAVSRYSAVEGVIGAFIRMCEENDMESLLSIKAPDIIFSLKYSALMPDAEAASESAAAMKLSNNEQHLIKFFAGIRSDIIGIFSRLPNEPPESEIVRIILASNGSPVAACMSALAQLQAEGRHDRVYDFIKFSGAIEGYFRNVFVPRASLLPLVTGEEIMSRFNLKQSPLIGECLRHVGNLVILGLLTTKEEAFSELAKLISSKNIQ